MRETAPGAIRIEAGSLRGRSIAVPASARPTEGRVRGALLSIWSDRVPDARFLDLFAGSGAVGIEAVSRGALEAVFVESDRRAVEVLRRNLSLIPRSSGRLMAMDAEAAAAVLASQAAEFDLIFLDPPYARVIGEPFLEALARLAAPDAELAIEHSRRREPPVLAPGWVRRDLRRYGDSALSVYGRTEA